MTPELEILRILCSIIGALKGTPLTLLIILVFTGPWVAMFTMSYIQGKRLHHTLDMYRGSLEAAKIAGECCRDYKEVMMMTIEKLTKVIEAVDNNLYCPVVRKQTRQKEI